MPPMYMTRPARPTSRERWRQTARGDMAAIRTDSFLRRAPIFGRERERSDEPCQIRLAAGRPDALRPDFHRKPSQPCVHLQQFRRTSRAQHQSKLDQKYWAATAGAAHRVRARPKFPNLRPDG